MGAENLLGKAQVGQRNVKRSRVLLAARLETSRGDIDARLRDLSQKGALVECRKKVPLGEEVVFVRGDTVVPARVAWVGGDRLGLEFLEPIEEKEALIHVSSAKSASSQTRFRRPMINEGLTDYERKLARVVGRSLGVQLIDE